MDEVGIEKNSLITPVLVKKLMRIVVQSQCYEKNKDKDKDK